MFTLVETFIFVPRFFEKLVWFARQKAAQTVALKNRCILHLPASIIFFRNISGLRFAANDAFSAISGDFGLPLHQGI